VPPATVANSSELPRAVSRVLTSGTASAPNEPNSARVAASRPAGRQPSKHETSSGSAAACAWRSWRNCTIVRYRLLSIHRSHISSRPSTRVSAKSSTTTGARARSWSNTPARPRSLSLPLTCFHSSSLASSSGVGSPSSSVAKAASWSRYARRMPPTRIPWLIALSVFLFSSHLRAARDDAPLYPCPMLHGFDEESGFQQCPKCG
jgi:hypothetical protein